MFQTRLYQFLMPRISQFVTFVAAGFLGLVIFSNLPYFIDDTAAVPVAAKLFGLLIGFALLIALLNLPYLKGFFKSPIFPLLVYIAVLYAVSIYRLQHLPIPIDAEEIDAALNRLQQFLVFPAAALILHFAGRKVFEYFVLVGVVFIPVPVILSFAFPDMSESFEGLRGAGFYLNANQAAEGVILWLLVLQNRFKGAVFLLLFLIASVAILSTFSRSGILAWAIIGFWLVYRGKLPRISIAIPIVAIVFYSALIFNAEEIVARFVDNQSHIDSLVDRLSIFDDLGSQDAIDDNSSEERQAIFNQALSDSMARPLLGHGRETFFALGLSSHNFIADLWYTFGIFGLFLYAYIGFLLYRCGKYQGMGLFNPYLIYYIVLTPFDHQHLSSIYFMTFFAYVIQTKSYWREVPHSRRFRSVRRRHEGRLHENDDYARSRRKRRRRSIRF